MPESPVAVGQTIAGKYRVERVIGKGGMGVVVAAVDTTLERNVAIKFLLPDYAKDDELATRFTREAKALAKMHGQHVTQVHEVASLEGGLPYMVMEYLEGKDLAATIRERGPVPHKEAVPWILEACEAVAEAHGAGIIHRDLKPANIFLARRSNQRTIVKVLDFGISKAVDVPGEAPALSLTSTSAMLGSPLYMAPEQLWTMRDIDIRIDI